MLEKGHLLENWKKHLATVVAVTLCILFGIMAFIFYGAASENKEKCKDLQESIETISQEKEELENDLYTLNNNYEDIIAKHKNCDATISDLKARIEQLNGTIDNLNAQIEELKNPEPETTSSQPAAVSGGVKFQGGAAEDTGGDIETVYWTPKGKVYHSTQDCPSLGRLKTILSGTIAESGKSRGCKVCY
ncbi:hypothetical protein GKG47_08805 [Lactonifactor sp. BIOML-A3]|uniref:hypothetical protein n=1 Tax=unclassified Lactonifactor TaxID=2636670 RepID=UPI0012B031B7|nr:MULTISPECIES: hypothetical protein [unclassified Lactonifactor]MSA02140.1 hypothetical protein [Lactonifactor sp. BIOML-A5]MSA07924.1 hypothetical protein [Lactonifactor sp. BIOML-A4]MSA12540.1 hypothetical protein [Lactonifactor sp. BIOML-A3]MSA16759.1 hypothetical protein [Lactonifactor sp. BIOML-A2]MSA37542.1 hypothetical protein [Lactonifactor sp. BIOML-A1]